MNTRAACRTYSVLVNEARPVAAALLQIQELAPADGPGGSIRP